MVGARIVRCKVFYEMIPEKFIYDVFMHLTINNKSIGGSLFHSFGKRLK